MSAVAVNRVRGMDVATDHQDARGYYLKNVSEGSELQTTAFLSPLAETNAKRNDVVVSQRGGGRALPRRRRRGTLLHHDVRGQGRRYKCRSGENGR